MPCGTERRRGAQGRGSAAEGSADERSADEGSADDVTAAGDAEADGDAKVISLILRTLQTTSAWQQKIHFAHMGCDQATITLGLPSG